MIDDVENYTTTNPYGTSVVHRVPFAVLINHCYMHTTVYNNDDGHRALMDQHIHVYYVTEQKWQEKGFPRPPCIGCGLAKCVALEQKKKTKIKTCTGGQSERKRKKQTKTNKRT